MILSYCVLIMIVLSFASSAKHNVHSLGEDLCDDLN
jgi:hypothetical protein